MLGAVLYSIGNEVLRLYGESSSGLVEIILTKFASSDTKSVLVLYRKRQKRGLR